MNGKRGKGISRREFARRAALASAAATIAPAALSGGVAGETEETASRFTNRNVNYGVAPEAAERVAGGAGQQPANTPKLSAESQAEAEARYQAILGQYGKRFSEEQKADLRRLCFVAQPPLDRLRAYALVNGDAPALYLKPLVEREKNPLEGTRKGKTPAAAKKDAFHAH